MVESSPAPTEPSSHRDELLWATWITFAFAVLAVVLRFASRRIAHAGFWYDDYLIIFPLALSTAMCSWTTVLVNSYGFGNHSQYTDPGFVVAYFKYLYAYQLAYTLWISTVKYCVVLLLWRIFAVPYPQFKKWLFAVTGLITAWCIAIFFTSIFSCIPARAFWGAAPGKCVPSEPFFYGNAVPNIITDVILILLPVPYIIRLNVTTSQKVAIFGIFLMGSFIVAVSIVRLTKLLTFSTVVDISYVDAPTAIWTIVEGNCAIIAACLPSLAPLLAIFVRRTGVRTSTSPTSTGYSSNSSGSSGWRKYWRGEKSVRTHDSELGDLVALKDAKAVPGTSGVFKGGDGREIRVEERSLDSRWGSSAGVVHPEGVGEGKM